jgi:hypothetical protein
MQHALTTRNYFEAPKNGRNGYGSAHYIIDFDGTILRCIPDSEVAYHCGSSTPDPVSHKIYTDWAREHFGEYAVNYKCYSPNNCTIGIELCTLDNEGSFTPNTLSLLVFGQALQALPQVSFGMDEARQELNLLQSKRSLLTQTYKKILTQYNSITPNLSNQSQASQPNSPAQTPTMPNFPTSSAPLRDLLNQGSSLFNLLDSQLATAQTQLAQAGTRLDSSDKTMMLLQERLSAATQTIAQLSANLKKAQDWAEQMGQRLQDNNEDLANAYNNLDTLTQQNAYLKQQAAGLQARAGRNGLIGFAFAGIGYGVGIPLMVEGIRADNQTMLWSGAGSIIGSTGIWLLGRYVFNWW